MAILVTGAAGFIGFHVANALLLRGETVIGIDNLNSYYDVGLKISRLAILQEKKKFTFFQLDITDRDKLTSILLPFASVIDNVIHLAAQAGVRYSITHPFEYIQSNILGHLVILEWCRQNKILKHLVYASSSSVYGGNTKLPFSIEDSVDSPVSLYAATKKSDELMSHCYSHLYGIPQTGLRFFTVYGPWGRPDMAIYLFSDAIVSKKPLKIFNFGDMHRDFTYIDDIVLGVISALDHPPSKKPGTACHRVYNIGNSRSENLMKLISLLEDSFGQTAEKEFLPISPGDVPNTYADIDATRQDLGFEPTTPLEIGIPRFVDWYRSYHKI